MGKVIKFEIGCRCCDGLTKVDQCTYICGKRAHLDDSSIFLIKNGIKTSEWNICKGKYYRYKEIQ